MSESIARKANTQSKARFMNLALYTSLKKTTGEKNTSKKLEKVQL